MANQMGLATPKKGSVQTPLHDCRVPFGTKGCLLSHERVCFHPQLHCVHVHSGFVEHVWT